eukprot:TRINITY_DN347_c1_g1_i1.p1 TRINITY_DN347_c1_g1~~TRINITY_DN347_c1_g1_i1.p1  ORF type:complete len:447 (-),score=69.93 TRINITY_DN347_c1_g1_i1:44-1384(-)
MDKKKEAALPPLGVRTFVLFLLFMIAVGPCLGYASVGALYSLLRSDPRLLFTDVQISFLFAVYSLPNMVAVFVAGILTDKIGHNKSLMICAFAFVLGNMIIVVDKSYFSFVIGRMLYGLGTECVSVVQSALVARWFSNDPTIRLSVANSFCMLSFRIGAVISMFFLPYLALTVSLDVALQAIAAFAVVSGIAALLLLFIDLRYEAYLSSALSPGSFSWSGVFSLPKLFWVMVLATFFVYAGLLPVISFITQLLEEKWGLTSIAASSTASIFYFCATVTLVPMGIFIDRYAHRMTLAVLSALLPVIAHFMLGTTYIAPALPIAILGFSYSLFPATIWPSIPLIIGGELLGTAFGIITCALNIGLFLCPLMLGILKSVLEWYTYDKVVLVLMVVSLCGLLSTIAVWYLDFKNGSQLELTCILKTTHKSSTMYLGSKKKLTSIRLDDVA